MARSATAEIKRKAARAASWCSPAARIWRLARLPPCRAKLMPAPPEAAALIACCWARPSSDTGSSRPP
ncbi:MAG: hypothetical protein E5V30_24745 [Mesorhizobium sp.]|nr:MAG: hypothetical protein E5V30_24745 [Mesorhizobium sp.]